MKVLAQDRRIPAAGATADWMQKPIPQGHYLASDSYWRRPVTNYTPYQHPTIPQANSRNFIRSLCTQMRVDPDTGEWVGGNQFGTLWMWAGVPVHIVPAGVPRRPFRIRDSDTTTVGADVLNAQLAKGVPAPLDLEPGAGADHSANLYQPSTDTMWELFALTKSDPAGPYDTVGWGGVVYGWSKFKGTYRTVFRATGEQVQHEKMGASATSISLAAGIPDQAEFRAGAIEHAIPLSVGHAQGSPLAYLPPATRGDGIEYDRPDYIPEGARVVIRPDFNVNALPYPEFRPYHRAVQKYGFVIMDKTGGGVAPKLREMDGWEDVLTLYKTDALAAWRYAFSLPWKDMIVIDPSQSA